MASSGDYLYCYCIIGDSQERIFNDVVPIGNPAGLVYTISYDGMAMVVSESPIERYESTRTNMLAHERVMERVMGEFTLLPVRFGTVVSFLPPEKHIRKLLWARGREFKSLLADMDGKVELGLKAFWKDEKLVYEEIMSQSQTIRRLRDSIQGRPPLATHFERIRLGEMVKAALDRKRMAVAAQVLAPLAPIPRATVENPTVVDRMVVNAAFLVEKGREEEFDRVVRQLDQALGERMAFKYVGPVPPYNFVNIVVNWDEILGG